MEINLQPSTPNPTPAAQSGCLGSFVMVLTTLWILSIAWIRQGITLTSTITPDRTAQTVALIGAGVQIVLTIPLLLLLSSYWPNHRYRLVFRGWLAASVLVILTAPIFLTGPTVAQTHLLLQTAAVAILIAILLFWKPGKTAPGEQPTALINDGSPANTVTLPPSQAHRWILAVTIGSALAYPWLAWGALGSILDTILGILFCLALGLIAALILELYLLPALQIGSNFWGDYFLGGLSIGVMLVILAEATAFAFGAVQQFLMIILPGLGWAIIAIDKLLANSSIHPPADTPEVRLRKPRWPTLLPAAILIGLAAAGPVLFIDPDELALVISMGAGEMLAKGYSASFISMATGLAFGLILLILLLLRGSQRGAIEPRNRPSRPVTAALWVLALLFVGAGAGVYFSTGQSGWYGERMFVILKDQADVSTAREMTDYNQRRQFVHHTLVEHADSTQADLRRSLDRLGIHYTPYYLVNAIEVGANPALRLWLNTRPEVDRILDSPRMRPLPERPPLSTGSEQAPRRPQWNLTEIGADRVWNESGITGQGIVIGQSDSGAEGSHPELAASYRGINGDNDYNWFDPWNGTTSPNDTGGHGTHTLGSILGKNTGVAPGAQWIACVNLARNLGNPALYLDCWQFMLAPFPIGGDPFRDGDPARGAHVLNNSWGCPEIEGCDGNTYTSAVKALSDAGIFVVASAGNDGPACATLEYPPPIYAEALAVGAIDRAGELASFSSIGPVTSDGSQRVKPDLVAPGVGVLSSFPGKTYASLSGTSMAGPHVAGVVALMWAANPALIGDIQQTADILHQTASPYTGSLPNCPGATDRPSTAMGYGIVDAFAAVNAAIQIKK